MRLGYLLNPPISRSWFAGIIAFSLLVPGVVMGQPEKLAKHPAPDGRGPVPLPPPVPMPHRPPPQPPWFLITQPWLWPLLGAAVAVKRKREHEEEEEMSPHQSSEPAPVEYKIIRSNTGAFKSPVKFRAALEEEARAGWELFEKLDCSRVRLRRPIACREKDADLTQDPYRTNVGVSQGMIALWIVIGILVGIGAVLGIVALVLKR